MSIINMMPREHHYTFSHRLLPRELFKDPARIVGELMSPMGGTFLFFLWEEIGKVVAEKLKHVDTGSLPGSNQRLQVLKLDVVGAAKQADKILILISLPPTQFPGEAMFVAVVQDGSRARYFAYERTSGIAALGESPDSAYLGEYLPDQSRVSHGAQPGTDAASFVRALCSTLGMSFDQAWASVGAGMPDPVAAGAFASAHGARPAARRLSGVGGVLSGLLVAMIAWPIGLRVLGPIFYAMFGPMLLNVLHALLSTAMGITLLVWMYQLFSGLKGKVSWTPLMAVLAWLIPVVNLALPPVILRAGWRAVSDNKGGLLPLLWWPLHLAVIFFMIFWQLVPALNPQLDELGLDAQVLSWIFTALSWLTTLLELAAYGLLLHIVRTITRRA